MYDIVVVGGGPGGYASALYAHNFGLSVALVDDERPGGTCLIRFFKTDGLTFLNLNIRY